MPRPRLRRLVRKVSTTYINPSCPKDVAVHGDRAGKSDQCPPQLCVWKATSTTKAHKDSELTPGSGGGPPGLGGGPRPVKRRGTANRKERRRTQSINSAFAELRECIPNVPADTKLSKIKTLRLATSYIAYLMDLLAKDDANGEAEAFKAEIKKTDVKEDKRKKELNEILKSTVSSNDKKTKGRTGWPQHVWALELKQ
nr:heart- and neural crest derivatives-expressed protein 2 [Pogona vitticeps]